MASSMLTVHSRSAPATVWANDGAWFLYTDYDGCETKVVGSPALIDAILADDVLEAIPA
jgi:hypothetical protein